MRRWERGTRATGISWCYFLRVILPLVKKGPPPPLEFRHLPDLNYCRNLWAVAKGQGKKKAKHYKTKKGFPCTLSDPKGLPFCLCRPEREPLGSTFCLHLVCSSGFLAAFETTPGDARGKKETGNQGCFSGILSSGFLLPFTCWRLPFRAFRWLLHAFCPGLLVAFIARDRVCLFHLNTNHNDPVTHWSLVNKLCNQTLPHLIDSIKQSVSFQSHSMKESNCIKTPSKSWMADQPNDFYKDIILGELLGSKIQQIKGQENVNEK